MSPLVSLDAQFLKRLLHWTIHPVAEIALQQVSMFFRSDPKWEVVEPLKDIGKTEHKIPFVRIRLM